MIEGAGRAGIMTPDYYATLGVAPTSEDVVIRAAYLALMRRYHPDRNSSAEAAERARAITAAYAVLSDWDRRAEYDWMRAQQRTVVAPSVAAGGWQRPRPTALFAVAAMMVLLLVLAVSTRLPVRDPPNRLPERVRPQTKAANAAAEAGPDAVALPADGAGDVSIPVDTAPPADEPAPPLISIEDEPQPRPQLAKAPPRTTPAPSPRPPAPTPASATTGPKVATAKPSFSCRFAKGRGETAVCRDAGLASLDRHLAMLYGQSWGMADAAKRATLLRTRDDFLSSRDACRSQSCIRTVYLGRMREVSDIMAAK